MPFTVAMPVAQSIIPSGEHLSVLEPLPSWPPRGIRHQVRDVDEVFGTHWSDQPQALAKMAASAPLASAKDWRVDLEAELNRLAAPTRVRSKVDVSRLNADDAVGLLHNLHAHLEREECMMSRSEAGFSLPDIKPALPPPGAAKQEVTYEAVGHRMPRKAIFARPLLRAKVAMRGSFAHLDRVFGTTWRQRPTEVIALSRLAPFLYSERWALDVSDLLQILAMNAPRPSSNGLPIDDLHLTADESCGAIRNLRDRLQLPNEQPEVWD